MIPKRNRIWIVFTLVFLLIGIAAVAAKRQSNRDFGDFWGARYNAHPEAALQITTPSLVTDSSKTGLLRWNEIAINASGLDHTPVQPGETRVFGEQVGPCRAARAEAIVHIAMFDALNAIVGGYQSFTGQPRAKAGTNRNVAIAQAAHDTLVALFPSQKPAFDQLLAQDLASVPDTLSKLEAVTLGRKVAKAVLALKATDGSKHPEPRYGIDYIAGNGAGEWRQDPISLHPLALGANWANCKPFVLQSASQFRLPAFPALNSPEYTAAYNEVKNLGGDGVNTPTQRTADQTEAGLFWAYDGVPSLCAPPRLYNQIATQIAAQMGSTEIETARLLALINTAMGDAGITSWESKYFHKIWRPVGGIREGDTDGNPDTIGDAAFMALGAPASNLTGPNFTPPFPAYPSGHATFGGAIFEILRRFYGTDNVTFTFVSDELNGITKDNGGNIRPLRPRTFTSFSQAEEENGQSRIYLGIHWSYDKTGGITQGRQVAEYIFKRAFKRLP
jgi:membrane-associated phospholipid phosphatase